MIRRRSFAHLPLAALLATLQYAVAEPSRKSDVPKPDPWRDGSDIRRNSDGSIVVPIPDSHDPSRGAPAYGGGWAAGHVITPPAIADARAYPRGIVIRPPHTGDERTWPYGIWLAPDWGVPSDVLRGLEDRLQDGLGALGGLLTPHLQ